MGKVVTVRSCLLPLDLYYRVEEHLWVRREGDGTITLGMTDMAQTTAGRILVITFKPVGRFYPKGKVVAVVESGKWLGPVRTPLSGELIEVNLALRREPDLINRSPYTRGWLVRMIPSAWEEESAFLLTGEEAVAAYERYMEERDLDDCVHCEGYEAP
ncbi:MAG: hypothetical protein RQ897_02485 [Thermoflexus sp.]|jgi:glycine cleavage system H protein|nr:hypothetical protein [Thermoflexus sp.]MDT7947198.1 hypothetical protein [Thermoflexus sp.]